MWGRRYSKRSNETNGRKEEDQLFQGSCRSQIAHLAENIKSVICVNGLLDMLGGYSTPKTLAFDYVNGLALIEDLGSRVFGKMLQAGEDMTDPMMTAAELLADLGHRAHTDKLHFTMWGSYQVNHLRK